MLTCRYRPDCVHTSWIFTSRRSPSEDISVFWKLYSSLRYNLNTVFTTFQKLSSSRSFSIFVCLVSIISQVPRAFSWPWQFRDETSSFHHQTMQKLRVFSMLHWPGESLRFGCRISLESGWFSLGFYFSYCFLGSEPYRVPKMSFRRDNFCMQHQCCAKVPGYGSVAMLGCNSSHGHRWSCSCSYQTSDVRVMALFPFRHGKKHMDFQIS